MGPLERFCLDHALVLVSQLQQWRDEEPRTEFDALLVRHHRHLHEDRWLDALARLTEAPPVLPLPGGAAADWPVPLGTGTEAGALGLGQAEPAVAGRVASWQHQHRALILVLDPLVVAAVVDPFRGQDVRAARGVTFAGRYHAVTCVTPHAYAELAGRLGDAPPRRARAGDAGPGFRGGVGPANPPPGGPPGDKGPATSCWADREPLEGWAEALGYDPRTLGSVDELVEELWLGSPAVPVLPPGIPARVQAVEAGGSRRCWLVHRTSLHAWVATSRPHDEGLRDELIQRLGRRVLLLAVGPAVSRRWAEEAAATAAAAAAAGGRHPGVDPDGAGSLHVRRWEPGGAAEASTQLLRAAVAMGASDVHLEPKEQRVRVRFRVDGWLYEQAPLERAGYEGLLGRFKVLGGMLPDVSGQVQDGAGHLSFDGRRYDLRYAVTVVNGDEEALVVRILSSRLPALGELGLGERERRVVDWFLDQEAGMVVLTGPTGSGKTTTLYALLRALSEPGRSLVTIEQPIEKHFPEAKQLNVYPEGFTFGAALRSVLRQDPDVIMVGEVRDVETARTAVQAALTGHLVLTTVHAAGAAGVIERFCGSFGVDAVALSGALKLAAGQRLVRRPCGFCRTLRPATAAELEYFPVTAGAAPTIGECPGCPTCRGTGAAGRRALLEMLPVDPAVRAMVAGRRHPDEIQRYVGQKGFPALLDQATALLVNGELSLPEARRFVSFPWG